ncbi:MAG: hypothetical protein LQ346_001680 [Caloplaca aetnensis]|nr:MAG: hypothetical protein LQ346_001680 [Caloplaca aetnensis]
MGDNSLQSTGILKTLLMSDTDTPDDALNRAKSYFLVCAIVSNSLTFSLGPRLLDHEEAPDPDQYEGKNQPQIEDRSVTAEQDPHEGQANGHVNEEATENTSLLPEYVVRRGEEVQEISNRHGKHVWHQLSPRTRSLLDLLYAFLNAPLIGAIIGATIGLAPPLHQAFFNEPQQGGFFKAWLTSCIENVGSLFAALQVVVVGVKLSKCLRKMKRVIYLLTVRTNALPYDPILFFCMMLMPAGPPAMAISSLAETNDSSEEDKMAISKFLIIFE